MVGSRRIVVELVGDASSLKRGLNDGEQALSGFSGKAQAAGRIAGKVLAGGLLLAGAAAIKATQAAAEDEAAQSQLAQQLRQAANASDGQISSTEAWITAQGVATGITDDELRPALARLATATGDVGEAQRLAALAMDVSAGSGKSYQQVTEALAKAQNGNIGALGRLGIATKDAEGNTKSLTQIQQDLADKYNGAASKAAETAAGKQKILTTQFGELQEQIGAKLLPVMVKLGEVGLKMVTWVSNNTTTVGVLIGVLGSLLAITTAVGYATKVWGALTALSSVAVGIHAGLTGADTTALAGNKIALAAHAVASKVAAAGQWLLNAAMSANPVMLVVIAIAALVAGFILAYKHSETFRNIVDAAFGAIKGTVLSVVTWIVDFIKKHWLLILTVIAGPMGLIVGLVIKNWDTIKNVITVGMAIIKQVIGAAWDFIVGAVKTVLGVYKSIIVNGFSAIREYLGNVVAGWKTLFNNAWDVIKSGFAAVRDKFVEIAGAIRDKVAGAFNAIKDTIQGVIDKVQWLIDKIQDLIDKIKNIPGIPGMGKVAAKASGKASGRTAGDTAGAVAAASRAVDAVGAVAARGAGGTGAAPVYVTIRVESMDPLGAGKAVVEALRKVEQKTGRPLLVSPA